jgi:hypothetical protein
MTPATLAFAAQLALTPPGPLSAERQRALDHARSFKVNGAVWMSLGIAHLFGATVAAGVGSTYQCQRSAGLAIRF